jgi:hypothetical protein
VVGWAVNRGAEDWAQGEAEAAEAAAEAAAAAAEAAAEWVMVVAVTGMAVVDWA